MGFIKDTCVFIGKIKVGSEILNIATHCKKMNKELCVTDIVLDEIPPGRTLREKEPDKAKLAQDLANSLDNSVKMGLINVLGVKGTGKYQKNYKDIRDRYYRKLSDPRHLREMIKNGECTKNEAKYLKYKDAGECSCIAVAMEYPNDYIIVTEDKGRIFMRKEINLFEVYKESHNIQVWSYDEWAEETNYESLI
ncbi:MAG: hypothetical protein FH761_17970 [Firmicutes bacterium]|nr:hypothetical protein [Bacillota bacterium]